MEGVFDGAVQDEADNEAGGHGVHLRVDADRLTADERHD